MLLAILSAILLILAFPNFNLSYLSFIGFIPLFFTVENTSYKKTFFIFYVSGFIFYLGILYWLTNVTFIGFIVLCLYLAFYFGIFGILFKRFSIYSFPLVFILVPLSWVFLEYIQAHLFSGFGWALLGYSQYRNLYLIQIADFLGVYGVSFVIILFNAAIWAILKLVRILSHRAAAGQVKQVVLIILAAAVFSYGYGFYRLNGEKSQGNTVKISIIQGNIAQALKWDPNVSGVILTKYIMLTKLAALDKPDLIIWPETAFPGYFGSDIKETIDVFNLVTELNIPLLVGANTEESSKYFNSAILISEMSEVLGVYNKIHLVPFGEYVPFSKRCPVLHKLALGELGEFNHGDTFRIFKLRSRHLKLNPTFSVLICFEDIFPELARTFVKSGAEFLVVITNDAWYGKTSAPYQHLAASVFRAVENRVPIARCANTGYSCFIDSRGRIYDDVKENNTRLFITGYKTSILNLN